MPLRDFWYIECLKFSLHIIIISILNKANKHKALCILSAKNYWTELDYEFGILEMLDIKLQQQNQSKSFLNHFTPVIILVKTVIIIWLINTRNTIVYFSCTLCDRSLYVTGGAGSNDFLQKIFSRPTCRWKKKIPSLLDITWKFFRCLLLYYESLECRDLRDLRDSENLEKCL